MRPLALSALLITAVAFASGEALAGRDRPGDADGSVGRHEEPHDAVRAGKKKNKKAKSDSGGKFIDPFTDGSLPGSTGPGSGSGGSGGSGGGGKFIDPFAPGNGGTGGGGGKSGGSGGSGSGKFIDPFEPKKGGEKKTSK